MYTHCICFWAAVISYQIGYAKNQWNYSLSYSYYLALKVGETVTDDSSIAPSITCRPKHFSQLKTVTSPIQIIASHYTTILI